MISVELTRRFKKLVRQAGRETEVSDALKMVVAGFGRPHLHSGLSIRKLGSNLYECRTSVSPSPRRRSQRSRWGEGRGEVCVSPFWVHGEENSFLQKKSAATLIEQVWRLVFQAQKGVLLFDFAGNHAAVQNYLRGR